MTFREFGRLAENRAASLDAELVALDISAVADIATETELPLVAKEARLFLGKLSEAGVPPLDSMALISRVNAALAKAAVDLLAERVPPSRRWCFLVFGSWARMEQTLVTDQDNGLVYELHPDEDPAAARREMLAFGSAAVDLLEAMGFPRCSGNVMASNEDFCMDSSLWREKFSKTLRIPTPDAILTAGMCFDMRGLAGDSALADELLGWVMSRAPDASLFLRLMGEETLRWNTGLGLLWGFRTDKNGQLDLKAQGSKPISDALRLMALVHGVDGEGTLGRMSALVDSGRLSPGLAKDLGHAFGVVQELRLRNGESELANKISPKELSDTDRKALLSAFRAAKHMQAKIQLDFGLR